MNKTRLYLYVIVGGYLAYTGFDLVQGAFAERPENYLLFIVIGIVFLMFGGILVIRSMGRIMRREYEDPLRDPLEEKEDAEGADIQTEEQEEDQRRTEELKEKEEEIPKTGEE